MKLERRYVVLLILAFLAFSAVHAQNQQNGTTSIGMLNWMTKNLDVNKFRNGDVIRQVKTSQEWIAACRKKEPVWMYYKNNVSLGSKYGKIYNYYAVVDSRMLAPAGYHIPAKNELEDLAKYSSYSLKSTSDWYLYVYRCKTLQNVNKIDRNGFPYVDIDYVETECSKGGPGDNSSGFNALPAGSINSVGVSESLTNELGLWCATSGTSAGANSQYALIISWNSDRPEITSISNFQGFYVRCVFGKSIDDINYENLKNKRIADSIMRAKKISEDSIYAEKIRIADSAALARKKYLEQREKDLDSITRFGLKLFDSYKDGIVVKMYGNGHGLLFSKLFIVGRPKEYYTNSSEAIERTIYAELKKYNMKLPVLGSNEVSLFKDLYKDKIFRYKFKGSEANEYYRLIVHSKKPWKSQGATYTTMAFLVGAKPWQIMGKNGEDYDNIYFFGYKEF